MAKLCGLTNLQRNGIRNQELEIRKRKCGSVEVSKGINTEIDRIQATSQNLSYEIQKAEKVRRNFEDEIYESLLAFFTSASSTV